MVPLQEVSGHPTHVPPLVTLLGSEAAGVCCYLARQPLGEALYSVVRKRHSLPHPRGR